MERQPLHSLEYESTYLELRPECERLSDTTNASLPARVRGDLPVHDAVAFSGIAPADTGIVRAAPRTVPATPLHLWPRTVGPAQAPCRPAGPRVGLLRRSTRRTFSAVRSEQLPSRHRARSWTLLGPGLLVVVSASLGIAAELDVRAARGLFVALTGALLVGWARLAWRGTARADPFGATVTRSVDRLVTAVGTLFAIALWAKYAALASTPVSRTVVLVLCGLGMVRGLLRAAQHLLP